MNDKTFSRFLFVVAALFIAWFFLHRKKPVAPNGSTPFTDDPELLVYASNPSAFGPQTVNGTVEINVRGYNGINQNYMPLFGFVGMAQGTLFQ